MQPTMAPSLILLHFFLISFSGQDRAGWGAQSNPTSLFKVLKARFKSQCHPMVSSTALCWALAGEAARSPAPPDEHMLEHPSCTPSQVPPAASGTRHVNVHKMSVCLLKASNHLATHFLPFKTRKLLSARRLPKRN